MVEAEIALEWYNFADEISLGIEDVKGVCERENPDVLVGAFSH
jgi:hypothetical protein